MNRKINYKKSQMFYYLDLDLDLDLEEDVL